MLARDGAGKLKFSGIFPLNSATSPLRAEVLDVLKGLEMSLCFGVSWIVIDTDYLKVVHGIQGATHDGSKLAVGSHVSA